LLALKRNDFGNLEARRLHDILQMARTEPAHGLTQPTKGRGRNVRAARQPVAEHDVVAGSGTDAVGRQQPRDLLDVQASCSADSASMSRVAFNAKREG
jgi:hypothetical protein